jgi:hypothetical protein
LAYLEYDISKCWHRLKTPSKTKNKNKKNENIKFLNNLNKQLLKKQKQKTI